MPKGTMAGGHKTTGTAEIRSGRCEKCHIPFDVIESEDEEEPDIRLCPQCGGNVGELLVTFCSEDAKGYWGNEYQKQRIIYCMRHRRDIIPKYLRTGGNPPKWRLRYLIRLLFGRRWEAKRLEKLNLLRR